MKIFECKHCGNQAILLNNTGVPLVCCGEKMEALTANTKDAALEKHVPFVTTDKNVMEVAVGEVLHPMLPEHYIQWVLLDQGDSVQYKTLKPGDAPKASFTFDQEKAYTVYEFCNLHGLWKKEK